MDCTWWFLFISLKAPSFFLVIVHTNESSGRVLRLVTHNCVQFARRSKYGYLFNSCNRSEHTNVIIMHFVLSSCCWSHIVQNYRRSVSFSQGLRNQLAAYVNRSVNVIDIGTFSAWGVSVYKPRLGFCFVRFQVTMMMYAVGVGRTRFVSAYSILLLLHIQQSFGVVINKELQTPLSQLYISSLDFTTSGSC